MSNKKDGMVLAEILLAGTIISIAVASAVIVLGSLQNMLIDSQDGFEAQLKAREEIEKIHLMNFQDVSSYKVSDGVFNTDVSVSYRNDFTTDVTADVSWYEGTFQKHRIFNDEIVDWKRASGALDCDWLDQSKGILSSINFGSLNIDDENLITDVVALGNYVYVSADSATSSLPDLYVINVSDFHNSKIVGHLNTGPGIAAISAASHYVFAANAGSYQMQIIDVADPTHPSLVSQAKLPGAIISGSAGFGNSVHFFDNKMYIGLNKNAGPEFYVVNVSNPSSPITLGSYEIGSTVNGIDVQGYTAVVVSPGQSSVLLLDVSNPLYISEISRTTLDGWQTQGAQSVEMLGKNIFVGRNQGGFYSPDPEFLSINRDSLASTTAGLKIGATVGKVLNFGNYLYVVTSNAGSAFQIFHNEVSENASTTLSVSMSSTLSSRGIAVSCNKDAMYVVTQDVRDFFHIFSLP